MSCRQGRGGPTGRRVAALVLCLGLVAAVCLPASARRGRGPQQERGEELRAVGDMAEALESLLVPVVGEVVVVAEDASYDEERGVLQARGSVSVSFGGAVLRCDTLSVDLEQRMATGEGSCRLTRGPLSVDFARAELDLATLDGVVLEAAADGIAGRYRFRCQRLHRSTGGDVFISGGWFTPCGCDGRVPAWAVEAGHVRITPQGRVDYRRGWLRIVDRRVVPLPPGRFDASTGRASGLLMPRLTIGGNHPFSLGLPIYLATSRNTDVTLTPTYVDTRGVLLQGEFRYAIGPGEGGQLSVWAIRDAALLEDLRQAHKVVYPAPAAAGYSQNRFWGQWRHLQRSRHALFGAHLDVLRDVRILRDFKDDYEVRRTPYLASRVWGGVHRGRVALRAETEIVDDLTDVRNAGALHSLPRVQVTATRLGPAPYRDLRARLDLRGDAAWLVAFPDAWHGDLTYLGPYDDVGTDGMVYTHPAAEAADPDGSEQSGHYERGEPVRRTVVAGGRVRAALTWTPGGWLWLRPWAEGDGTIYGAYRYSSSPAHRASAAGGVELGTALFRDFGREGPSWRHVIEPRVAWESRPFVAQGEHPVLTVEDLRRPHHRLDVELINRLQRHGADPLLATQPRSQALELRVATALELHPDARFDPDLPLEPLRVRLQARHRHARLTAHAVVAWEKNPFQVAGLWGTLFHPAGNQVVVAYDWVRGGSDLLWADGWWYPLLHGSTAAGAIHQGFLGLTWVPYTFVQSFAPDPKRIARGLALHARWRVNLRGDLPRDRSRLLNHEYGVTYTSPCACWRAGVDLRFASDLDSPSFGVRFDLLTR